MDTMKLLERLMRESDTRENVISGLTKEATAFELADNLYDLYKKLEEKEAFTPVRISQADFDKHFRIIGTRSDGTEETRGRRRKDYGTD